MGYAVKEMMLTRQGEGFHQGRLALFVRFSGCNLWSGREKDRAFAVCQFCDTDFIGNDGPNGNSFGKPRELAETAMRLWERSPAPEVGMEHPLDKIPYMVCTGGEPSLQINEPLIDALKEIGFTIAIETNGTRRLLKGIDWICVSPKKGTELRQISGNELKLVFPQVDLDPREFANLDFEHHYLQPMDGPNAIENEALAQAYCNKNPKWKLSIQKHKVWQIA